MKPPIVILALLIGAFALGDFASVTYVGSTNQHWPDAAGVILLAVVFSQIMLLAAWFVFARVNIAGRVLIAMSTVFGLSFVAAQAADGNHEITPWFAIQLVSFCSFTVPLGMAKLLRWHISQEGQTNPASGLPSWQFSIWSLLSATTAAAIALGAARHVDMPLLVVGEAIAFFSCIALTGLLVFLVAMGIRMPALAALATLLLVVIVCPLAGILIGQTGFPPEEHPVRWGTFGFCYGATIAISVLALRIAGYRLCRGALATPTGEPTAGKGAAVQVAATRDAPVNGKPAVELSIERPDSTS